MANDDVLIVDSTQPGGSGQIAGQNKFTFAARPNAALPGVGAFLAGAWYSPGTPMAAASGILVYGVPTADILWAIPTVFGVKGTITDLATYSAGQGGSSTKVYTALYRSNAAKTAPAARVFSGEAVVANFAHTKTEFNGINIAVSANEVIWFSAVTSGPTCLGLTPVNIFPLLGTNFDGTGGANPLRAYQMGYRLAFPYAQPPDPWVGTTKLLATSDAGAGAAVPLFKFTPA